MAKRRAVTGFKGVALAPVTQNDITGYKSTAAFALPYVGSMSRTVKENTQDIYADDSLYAQLRTVQGEDVEVRFVEMSLEYMAQVGLGEYDEDTGTFEGNYDIQGKTFAFRCVTDTVDGLPYYFSYRVFDLNGIRFDNFTTKGSNAQVCEVIMNGVFSAPKLGSVKPYAIMQLLEDESNQVQCDAFIINHQPGAGPERGDAGGGGAGHRGRACRGGRGRGERRGRRGRRHGLGDDRKPDEQHLFAQDGERIGGRAAAAARRVPDDDAMRTGGGQG